MESLKVRNGENQVPLLSPEKEDLTEEINAEVKKVLMAQLKRLDEIGKSFFDADSYSALGFESEITKDMVKIANCLLKN